MIGHQRARGGWLAAALALVVAGPAHADAVARWAPLVGDASARCAVPADWIARVMRAESAGLTELGGRPIVSPAGAMGLMQLMPGTWGEMRLRLGLGADPHDPHDNILAGACYLRLLYDRFGYPGLFAAYNAGPARYADHLATGRALPGETRAYLASVGGAAIPAIAVNAVPANPIFFALRAGSTPDGTGTDDQLFVRLAGARDRAPELGQVDRLDRLR